MDAIRGHIEGGNRDHSEAHIGGHTKANMLSHILSPIAGMPKSRAVLALRHAIVVICPHWWSH